MALKRRIDVLIVGAGPVGMTAALALAKQGRVELEIVDEAQDRAGLSYALALHPSTLALLSDLGVADRLIAQGNPIERLAVYDGRERKLEMRVADLGGAFPYVLVLPQSAIEDALLAALETHKVRVRWNHRLRHLDAGGDDSVLCQVDQLGKESAGYGVSKVESVVERSFERTVSFLIGADGHGSLVRRQLEIERHSIAGPGVFATFELATSPNPANEMRITFAAGTRNVWWPLPGQRTRMSFEIEEEQDTSLSPRRKSRLPSFVPWRSRQLDAGRLNELVAARMPWLAPPSGELMWSVATRFERALVERFGRGRAWLAGDAAHLAFPFGVHSMNAGIREARDLASRIGRVLAGERAADSLEEYGRMRTAEWRTLLGFDGEPVVAPSADPWVRERARAIVESLPVMGSDAERLVQPLGITLAPPA
jgi:2-polyprenyl-6-methoxyphenol hydroxylase-like FAD-dependent oxidoreductase